MSIPLTLSSVPAQTPYIQYVATAGQTVFPYPFEITQDSDLVVVYNGVAYATDAGYTLSGQGDTTGGDVTFTAAAAAGDIITLYRDISIERLTQFGQNSGFSSTAFNAEFNNVYLLLQQLQSSLDQCLQVPNTNNPAPTTSLLPANYANKYLAFDVHGNPTPAQLTSSGSLTQAILAGLLNPQTPAEQAAGVVPANDAYPELDLRRYGAALNGTTNDAQAILDAIAVAEQYTAATIVFPQNSNVRCDSLLTWDISKVGIDLNGSVLSFANVTAGACLTPATSQTNNNVPIFAALHLLSNGQIVGPGAAVTAVSAVNLTDAHATPNISGCFFKNLAFVNFATDATFGNGAFCETFEDCVFTMLAGAATTYSIIGTAGAVNSGERNIFRNCWWYNKPYLIQQENADSDMFVEGGSMDGFTTAVYCTAGTVQLFGVHIEGASDTAYWFNATGQNAAIMVEQSSVLLDANKAAYTMFYSDATTTNGGIFLADIVFAPGSQAYTASYGLSLGPVLIGGTGNCRVRNVMQFHGAAQPGIAAALNSFAYGGFESANYTAEWTLTAGAVRSNAAAHSFSYSLSFPASSGVTPTAVATFPCAPGQYAQGSLWYLGSTLATEAATLYGTLAYVDKGGNPIQAADVILDITANTTVWTLQQFKMTTPAPAGTASVQLFLDVFGATAATTAYVDDILLNVV